MTSHNKIQDIEVLRGVAVLAVLVHHMRENLFTWASAPLEPNGLSLQLWWGVDLFFVISGFVITRSLLPALRAAHDQQRFWGTSVRFWIRRAWRLLPTAWLWLVIAVLLAAGFNQSGAFGDVQTNIQAGLAGFLHYANVRFATSFLNYDYGVSFVYWSLALEEQFYVLFPLLVFVTRRWLAAAMVVVVLVQAPLDRTIWHVVFRSDALALGILIALWQQHREASATLPATQRVPVALRPWLFAGLLVLMWLAANANLTGRQIQFTLVAWIAAILVVLAAQDKSLLLGPGLLKRLMCWLGSRSYGMYVIHIPAYLLTREIWYRLTPEGTNFGQEWTLPFLLTALVLLVCLSELNYRLVETPLRNKGRRMTTGTYAGEPAATAAGPGPIALNMTMAEVAQESSITTRNN